MSPTGVPLVDFSVLGRAETAPRLAGKMPVPLRKDFHTRSYRAWLMNSRTKRACRIIQQPARIVACFGGTSTSPRRAAGALILAGPFQIHASRIISRPGRPKPLSFRRLIPPKTGV